MCKRNILFGAIFLAVTILPAAAVPQSSWAEAHAGGYLGVTIAGLTPQQAASLKLQDSSGALITYVDQDGPACHAGLMENDVVVAFNGSKVETPEQLQGLIHTSPPQKPVTLTILRNAQRKDVKVTLGTWRVASHVRGAQAFAMSPPLPPRAYLPDVEIPSFAVLSSRHGLVVESLSPQLADFFGVPHGHGVLIRSVEGGSPAAAAGLKAGDVILKVNNETVHDMSDWQRSMQTNATKVSVGILREKHEQTLVINLPGSGDTSRLHPENWLGSDTEAQALRDQVDQIRPQIEAQQETLAQLGPSDQELEQMRREIEKSMKQQQKDIDKMAREMAKSAKPAQKEMEQMQRELQKSIPSQQDIDEMKREVEASVPSQKDLDEMKREVRESVPSQQELDDMRRQAEDSMKNWTPQMQQQMEQLKKEMEQHKLDLQQMMQEFSNDHQL
ncbi:MAG: PDZ domain-containing protein [Candidatus Korobacteraceae bacterium]